MRTRTLSLRPVILGAVASARIFSSERLCVRLDMSMGICAHRADRVRVCLRVCARACVSWQRPGERCEEIVVRLCVQGCRRERAVRAALPPGERV